MRPDKLSDKKLTEELELLEVAEDLQRLERGMKYRPGYKKYLTSPEHSLELFLDSLDTERGARR
jgi:hypothetical protein